MHTLNSLISVGHSPQVAPALHLIEQELGSLLDANQFLALSSNPIFMHWRLFSKKKKKKKKKIELLPIARELGKHCLKPRNYLLAMKRKSHLKGQKSGSLPDA